MTTQAAESETPEPRESQPVPLPGTQASSIQGILHSGPASGFGDKFAGWSVLFSILLFLITIGPLMGFLPPMAPSLTAAETAAYYSEHSLSIRVASMLLMLAAGALLPIYGAMSGVMLRMKGRPLALSATQLAAGALVVVNFLASGFFFGAAAFRVERAVGDVQVLSDLAWFFLVMPAPPACLSALVFGLAVLADDRRGPVMPRWLGFFNLWMAVLFLPGLVMVLAHTGPLAWNSVLPFWIPLATFAPWCLIMGGMMIWYGGRVSRGEFS